MDALKGYESDGSDVEQTQVQEDSDEYAETIVQISDDEREPTRRSRSRSAGRVDALLAPDVDVDNLPPRRYGRQIPDGRPPKSTKGWSVEELTAVIRRCGLAGGWRQGGKQSIAIFQGEQFIINIYAKGTRSTVLVQGRRVNEIDARLRAARGA